MVLRSESKADSTKHLKDHLMIQRRIRSRMIIGGNILEDHAWFVIGDANHQMIWIFRFRSPVMPL
jgi:hypothetical protein